ncbi:MAG: leucine-rich repeat domain-containing protein [Candidatus Hermodarchaeota archaeon]
MSSYRGVLLFSAEAAVLSELEQNLRKNIPNVRTRDLETGIGFFGFVVENNQVIGLGLPDQGFDSLSESFGNLVNLQELWLYGNQLNTLPESFGQLKNLKDLYLGGNQLQSLPQSFGNLNNLNFLDLSDNQLCDLPEAICRLTNLQTLNLSGNHLTSLPETFGQLQNLKELFLRENQLHSLPESFGQLTLLFELDLSKNRLDFIPESFSNLSRLRFFTFDKNPLSGTLAIFLHARKGSIPLLYVPDFLLNHPLIQPLELDSLTLLSNDSCPFCGSMELVTGREKETGKFLTFCVRCENRLQ